MHMTTGEPDQLIVLPQPTYLPLVDGARHGGGGLALLFKFYLLALVAALVIVGLFLSRGNAPAMGATTVRCLSAAASACRRIPKWPTRRRGGR